MSTGPGQDMLIQGLVGLASNTGRGDGPPVPAGAGLADQIGAMNMVYGILSALYYREKTGKGQKIEVNLLAGMLAHLARNMSPCSISARISSGPIPASAIPACRRRSASTRRATATMSRSR